MLDYIYSEQASQYAYYRIPKILFTDDRYRDISTDAKVLYGLLLDRVSLSIKNKWVDDQNRVFIIFSLADVQESLNCGPQKATALFRELEKKAGLIERKRQGLGKPNLIYVKNFCEAPRESAIQNHENHPSGMMKNEIPESTEIIIPESRKSSGINTNLIKTESSNLKSSHSILDEGYEAKRDAYDRYLDGQLQLEVLRQEYPLQQKMLEEIKSLILSVLMTDAPTVRVRKQNMPTAVVKSQFMKLDADHIRMVMDGLTKTTTQIKDVRQYLLAAIYNAPDTIDTYYQLRVNHDMAQSQNPQEANSCQNQL